MKIKKTMALKLLVVMALTIGFTSCSKKGSTKGGSSATGWKINDKKGGFQFNDKFKKQQTPPGMLPVEGGTFTMGKVQDDVLHDWNNSPNQQHVQSFFMDETEVTNKMYAEYLYWVKAVFPPTEENYKNIYNGAIPDTLVWRNRLGYNETMTNNYLRHPAYANYPVVGVNWIQATEFCKWRTNRVNENILEQAKYLKKDNKVSLGVDVKGEASFDTEAYINSPSKSLGGNEEVVLKKGANGKKQVGDDAKNLYAQRSSGLILPEYRLPTESEWEYAAVALVGNREYNIYKGQKKYPWNGQYTRSSKRQSKGDQLANFKQGKGDYGGIAGWSDDGADITNEVKRYAPNDFGLYDMAGNVAEWVQDVYRPMVDDEANDFNYFRGNVYTKNKLDGEGNAELVTSDNIKYDTLSNGRIMAINFPGQIAQVPVDENETFLRTQFSTSDNRNYRDGDRQSTRFFKFGGSDEENAEGASEKFRMYESPKHKISTVVDSANNGKKMIKQYDKSDKRTTLVNDDVRVYKGGSWRDRAYWLDPASRRYFPQDMATDFIGFRCAMSKVGPKSNKKTPRGNPKQ